MKKNSVSRYELFRAANIIRENCRSDISCSECVFATPQGRNEACMIAHMPSGWPVFETEEENRKQIELVEG